MGQFAYRQNLSGAKDLLASVLELASVRRTSRTSKKSRGAKDLLVSFLVFGRSACSISYNENRQSSKISTR